jgi:hypothetical protein
MMIWVSFLTEATAAMVAVVAAGKNYKKRISILGFIKV